MAGLGFKDFQVGEVLTSSDVDGYLMQQTVMRFADSGARGSALGTAVGTGVALAEGMVSYLNDSNILSVYDGSTWVGLSGGFTASTAVTATDASWSVPTLASPVVRVTVIGGGGGGGGGNTTPTARGADGTSSSFAVAAGTAIAVGGHGGLSGTQSAAGSAATDGVWFSGNGGEGGANSGTDSTGTNGQGGEVTVAYFDLSGVSTAAITIGAGGTGSGSGTSDGGGDGGDGVVIVEYLAG